MICSYYCFAGPKVDEACKKEGLDAGQRLARHQAESGPVFDEIKSWFDNEIAKIETEPNGLLAGAINYWLKRWDGLTLFLRLEGVPLSNAMVERTIKAIIRQRKNSLQYKNFEGAERGDRIQSLIFTCIANDENPHDYLTAIQVHRSKVRKNPELWLPWNYKKQLSPNNSS